MIVDERISGYLRALDPEEPEYLIKLEERAVREEVPIIRKDAQALLRLTAAPFPVSLASKALLLFPPEATAPFPVSLASKALPLFPPETAAPFPSFLLKTKLKEYNIMPGTYILNTSMDYNDILDIITNPANSIPGSAALPAGISRPVPVFFRV